MVLPNHSCRNKRPSGLELYMWYKEKLTEIVVKLKSNLEKGLTQDTVSRLLRENGKNVLPKGKQTEWWQFLLRQFKSPLVYILIIASILTTWMAIASPEGHGGLREWVDTIVILMAVAINVLVGFFQEYRSNNILEKLKEIVKTSALVVREGQIHEIDAEDIVVGDIIMLKAGMKIPADARVIDVKRLEVSEAALTGESVPVTKKVEEIEETVEIGDRHNMVHMGTVVSRGEGTAIVVATGADSELGKIALLTQQAEDEPTPLKIRVAKLGRILATFVAFSVVVIFVFGLVEGRTFEEMFTTAIAVAVGAIPEGLPAGISIVLAVAAQRVLRKRGVIKKAVSTETIGSSTVICSDKTGTLTEGIMKVEELIVSGGENQARQIMALANEALVEHKDGETIIRGETTDKAKLQDFFDNGGDLDKLNARFPRISLLQFDPTLKYLASLHSATEKSNSVLYVTGAPEELMALSTTYYDNGKTEPLDEARKRELKATYEERAQNGFRMIGLAYKELETLPGGQETDIGEEDTRKKLIQELVFVGFAAIRDPIRQDVKESIQIAREAGIRTIMVTGDHILTAKAIGRELGYTASDESVAEGVDIEAMSDEELDDHVEHAEIYARVNPEHKMRIVAALQRQGEVVAMTGDGVNDAPALKAADVGVAVGSGTDIAKAASDLILLDDSFTVIVAAIRQGRIAFDNIRKVTVFMLAGSFTELILVLSSLIFRIPLPITAVQILWTNLVADSLPNVALAFEPGEKDIMKRPPNKRNESILDTESKVLIFVVGIFTDIVLMCVFLWFYFNSTLEIEHIRTIIFTGLGLNTFFYVFSIKSLRQSIWKYNLLDNKLLIGAVLIGLVVVVAAVYAPFLNTLLGTVPLTLKDWGLIVMLGLIEIIGVETAKLFFFKRIKKVPPKFQLSTE